MDKVLKKETIYLYIVLGANFLLPLITIPYLTKVLGLSGFGLFGYSQTIFLLFTFFIEFGFTLTGARSISIYSSDQNKINEIYSSIQVVRFLIYLLIFVLISLFLSFANIVDVEKNIIYLSLICAFSAILIPNFLFNGLAKNSILAFVTVILKIIFLLPIFIFVKNEKDILLGCFFQLFPNLLVGLVIQYIIWKKNFAIFSFKKIKSSICILESKRALDNFIASFFTLSFTYFTPLLVKYALGNSALGLYTIIDKLINVLRQLYNPLTQAFFSKLSILYIEEQKKDFIDLLSKVALLFILIGISVFFGNLLLGDIILPILLGRNYHLTYLLSIAIMTQLVVSMALILVNFIIIPSDNSYILKKIYFIAMLIYLPISLYAVKYFELQGVLYSMLFLEIGITFYLARFCQKKMLLGHNFFK